jgi:hypothetical protein
MPIISEKTMVARSLPLVQHSLLATNLSRQLVANMSKEKFAHIRQIIQKNNNLDHKVREFMSLFDRGQISPSEAKKAFTGVEHLWKKLDVIGDRRFELSISDDIYSSLPQFSLIRMMSILGWNFSDLSSGMDYDHTAGRSVFYKLHEPVSIGGRTIRQIKLKGVCFDADKPLSPFTDMPPWISTVFGPDGKVLAQIQEPYKPKGAMDLKSAGNEFSLMELAFKRGGNVVCPLGLGRFNDGVYNNSPLGFVVHGMEGNETDLRSAFADLVGEGKEERGHYVILLDPVKVMRNKGNIMTLFSTVGRTYRDLHDIGITQGALHPGNILVGSDIRVFISDFESGRNLSGTTLIQNVAYRANQIRSFVWYGCRIHLNDNLLYALRQNAGIDIAKLFLDGYFHDRPSRNYGIDILADDQINKILAAHHLGVNVMDHPLMDELKHVVSKIH